MPAYLVKLDPEALGGKHLRNGHSAAVIFAADATDAKRMAQGYFDEALGESFDEATATEVVVGTALDSEWSLYCTLATAAVLVDVSAVRHVASAAIAAGGTGYSVNDILTLSTGSGQRAATFRVTSVATGVVDGIEVVDPGDYEGGTDPSAAGATTGGGGSGCTLTPTMADTGLYGLVGAAVTALNATTPVSNAVVDMGAATPILTIAGAADSLGDDTAACELRYRGVAVPSLVGTITDQGASGAAVTALLPAAVLPRVLQTFRQ